MKALLLLAIIGSITLAAPSDPAPTMTITPNPVAAGGTVHVVLTTPSNATAVLVDAPPAFSGFGGSTNNTCDLTVPPPAKCHMDFVVTTTPGSYTVNYYSRHGSSKWQKILSQTLEVV